MLSHDQEVEEEEVFYDSLDYIQNPDILSSEDSGCVCEELVFAKSDYDIWLNEPGSIQERRKRFLHGMGFSELASFSREIGSDISCGSFNERLSFERITECSETVQSSWASFSNRVEEEKLCNGNGIDVESNFMAREDVQDGSPRSTSAQDLETSAGLLPSIQNLMQEEVIVPPKNSKKGLEKSKKMKSWWKSFIANRKGGSLDKSDVSLTNPKAPKANRMRVQQNSKRIMEFSGLFMGQEILAHKGFIWTMKFSPDGQYLASGGEDGIVRIWRVTSGEASCKFLDDGCTSKFINKEKEVKLFRGRKNSASASVVIPKKVFKIEESPLQEFHGHTSDILDLSWSKSNFLLSSSKDKTVRLWQVGCNQCLNVFQHSNYVTCIQFNPLDDGYFISGSIDGKVRIWGVSDGRVVDWADVQDLVTAICYQPDAQGFIVGTVSGTCRFYNATDNHLEFDAQICIQGRKKSSCNRITGIQFSRDGSQRVMITSSDSRVRIFDGVEVIHKYRGLRKSGSQMSASFTSNGRHIISVGEDSHVYVWNYDGLCLPLSKEAKSIRSCEHFFHDDVSVAIPWSGMEEERSVLDSCSLQHSSKVPEFLEAASWFRDSERLSLGGWFSVDCPSKGSATWPEEKLPVWAVEVAHHGHHHDNQQYHQHHYYNNLRDLSGTWGLVIVTAGWDGVIRTFLNFGLPVRL
ncbi:PREDICTED: transcription initiation factor TFIID subunit 5-like [Nelumbo nucifera]|uniref:Transcription initiation factor TFIID subunit 5-like n=2 Tax=Nelumbo nucifera TaxID=4432 RepID=A0A1U7YXI1_NELNU|nr:PREDICTED: transcription initiation factor TFIID subunit 5-like [Nelumbo nucifera]XP_010245260.1 PREDICTED: transcription initiation factor TFIID subunit 5-like [Nelumbo nucifera]XP_010245261.1 PREDICTED: transcription initiation factor TFIID subunit 5-like [Nelumbo nucifera]XP_010245262.1 PREDICTED: transcription initiation factor TFIID subunit 5-like [Nelumbo nucifera]XP_010245263.1 PREDICTED: transcription initiation factor TFIID subunit 5-like [Nelumbo nucifera]XP_010245265.1 PREDICTED: